MLQAIKSVMPKVITIEERKARVRVFVTKLAAIFVFGGGALLIAAMVLLDNHDGAKDLFNVLLAVGTGVISYWFAGRGGPKSTDPASPQQNRRETQEDQLPQESMQSTQDEST